MKNFVLRKKAVELNLQWLILLSPLFFFYPLLLVFQFFCAEATHLVGSGQDYSALIQSAIWVCFLPPIYLAFVGEKYLNKLVLTEDALYVGPMSAEKKDLSTLVEVGGETGSILNGFREGLTLVFSDGAEEILYLDDYDELQLREFLNRLKQLRPDCHYSYTDVIPLESRGLIKFIYQSSDSNSLIVKQTKTPMEDAIFQLVSEHKKGFYSLYLAGWMVVVMIFSGLSLAVDKRMSDFEIINAVSQNTLDSVKDAFPNSFKFDQPDANQIESQKRVKIKMDVDRVNDGHWFQSALVRAIVFISASLLYFSQYGFMPLLVIWCLIGFVLLVVIPVIRKLSPNFVFVDSNSVGQGLQFFPWDEVKTVELVRQGEFADPMDGHLCLASDINTFKIRLDRIPEPNVRMKVLRMLERYATKANFNDEFLRTTNVSTDIQFTDLWLSQGSEKGAKADSALDDSNNMALSQGAETIASGRYQIESVLGYGGQGTTYLARRDANMGDSESVENSEPEKMVVVKELVLPTHADVRIIQSARLRFEHASELLSQIEHGQIVRHHEHFIEGSNAYLVMEYIPGKTIRELVNEEGAMSEERVLSYGLQILEILRYLHNLDNPVIHCDLAPDNLIVTEEGVVKLIDFDVARVDGRGSAGVVAARPSYTPPEQFRGKPVIQSDIYAFGAILNFLLKGEDPPPFADNIDGEELAQSPLGELISWCCRFEAASRPDSADCLIDRLSGMIDGGAKIDLKVASKPKIA